MSLKVEIEIELKEKRSIIFNICHSQDSSSLLDKDWGSKVPDYITKGTFSLAVFFMSLTMRGDWIMFLAHYWRSQETDKLQGK